MRKILNYAIYELVEIIILILESIVVNYTIYKFIEIIITILE